MKFEPSYLKLFHSGELKRRALVMEEILKACTNCPRNCLTDRTKNEFGKCLSGYLPIVSSYTPHFGEEPVLSGTNGAGNIFFGNCNLKCVYCQNSDISQSWKSEIKNQVSFERLADIMIDLQEKNCHNIGFVSPTHFSSQILKSIEIAISKGLQLPLIYNTNGYDSVEILKLYDGVVDIYLPDCKYGNDEYAKKYSKVDDYFSKAKLALKEMYRQLGDEVIYDGGIMVRGLIIRHLVLPNDLSETEEVLKFITTELSSKVHLSIMSQYYPAFMAKRDILMDRTIRESEYEKVLRLLDKYGFENVFTQEMESFETYRPDFAGNRENPFSF
ncbi:MAG: radical SAM protein [Ignavibacteriaceae bacterium]